MVPFNLHKRIPLIRRPFFQRDQALRELADARLKLAKAESDLAEAQAILAAQGDEKLVEVEHAIAPVGQEVEPEGSALSVLQQRINEIPWYHEFSFPNGLTTRSKTPQAASHRALWKFMKQQLNRIDFEKKSVLDVGCWDGYWSFYAEKRGAARVLATDDATQNWAASAGVELAKELLGSSVEIRKNVSAYDLQSIHETFDIILLMGVYYHLVDPLYAMAEIRHRCHECSLVAIEGDFLPPEAGGALTSAFFDIGDPVRCFVPTLPCLRQFMEAAYFKVVSETTYGGSREQPVNRVFAVYSPIIAANARHPYRPPFGLHRYDPRFLMAA